MKIDIGKLKSGSIRLLGPPLSILLIVLALILPFYFLCLIFRVEIERSMAAEWLVASFGFYAFCAFGAKKEFSKENITSLEDAFASFVVKVIALFSAMVLPVAGNVFNKDMFWGGVLYAVSLMLPLVGRYSNFWSTVYPALSRIKSKAAWFASAFSIPLASTAFLMIGLIGPYFLWVMWTVVISVGVSFS